MHFNNVFALGAILASVVTATPVAVKSAASPASTSDPNASLVGKACSKAPPAKQPSIWDGQPSIWDPVPSKVSTSISTTAPTKVPTKTPAKAAVKAPSKAPATKSLTTRVLNDLGNDNNCVFCTVAQLLRMDSVSALTDYTGIMQEPLELPGIDNLLSATRVRYDMKRGSNLPRSGGTNDEYGVLYQRPDGSKHCVLGNRRSNGQWLYFDYQSASGREEVTWDVSRSRIVGTFWFKR